MVKAIPDFGDVICSRDEDGIHTNEELRKQYQKTTVDDIGECVGVCQFIA